MTSASLMQSPPGPEAVIDGVRYLYFGGTSYLGLAGHPAVITAACEALREFGVHSATTRARFGTTPPVALVESRAAEFFGTEDAFYFGSGYVANHIMVAAFALEAEVVLVNAGAHYCVLEAAQASRLPVITFPDRDPNALAECVRRFRRVLVLSDAVNPSDGSSVPVTEFCRALQSCERAFLVLDDAHGFGVLGEHGRGLLDEAGIWSGVNTFSRQANVQVCVCGTLAKALGGFGGIIPGSRAFLDRVRTSSHYFDGASAPASAEAGASAKALEIVITQPELRRMLHHRTQYLRDGLRGLGLHVPPGRTAHFGIKIGDGAEMERIHQRLKERGILVPYIGAYTGIPVEGLLRFAVFANHEAEHLDRLLNELRAIL